MGMTMTQKILAAHAGLDKVCAGQLIEADLDLVLGNDITSPVAIHEMDKMKVDGVFHKDKIALVLDHFVPNKDIKSAEHCKCVREFACKNDITLCPHGAVCHNRRNKKHNRICHIAALLFACHVVYNKSNSNGCYKIKENGNHFHFLTNLYKKLHFHWKSIYL